MAIAPNPAVNRAVAAKVPASSVFLRYRCILERRFGCQTVTLAGFRSMGAIARDFATLCFVLDSSLASTLEGALAGEGVRLFLAEDSALGSDSWGEVVMLNGV